MKEFFIQTNAYDDFNSTDFGCIFYQFFLLINQLSNVICKNFVQSNTIEIKTFSCGDSFES